MTEKLRPGTYRATEPNAWVSFTLHADDTVTFVDAGDGHTVYWGIRGPDGPAWITQMERSLAEGTLKREGS